MNTLYKFLAVLGLGAACFVGGWFSRRPTTQTATKTDTKIVDHTQVVTKVVKEVVREPAGATKETITTTVTEDKKTEREQDKQQQSVASVSASGWATHWSLAVNWTPRLDVDMYKPTGLELGYRLGDTNAWATVGADWVQHSATLGLRIEF